MKKATLKNTTVVDVAVRKNHAHRQEVARKVFVCLCAILDVHPAGMPSSISDLRTFFK